MTWLRLVSCVLVFAACGDDGGPTSEEHVTFDSLPEADRAAFEQWTHQAVKDCAWQQAFPSLATELADAGPPYVASAWVDLKALAADTGGVPLVAGANGQLVLLDTPTPDLGFANARLSTRRSVNGNTRIFEISATRDEGVCEIRLDGEMLFRGELAPAVPVIASYDGQVPAGAGSRLGPLLAGRAGADDVAATDGGALLAPAIAALTPTAAAHGVLAQVLHAREADARAAFPLRAGRAPEVAQLRSVATATPFTPRGRIYGPAGSLADLYAGGTVQAELLYAGLHADLIAIRAELAITAGSADVALVAITAAPRVAHDDEAARRCFTQRAVASRFEALQPRSPAFDEQFAGCAHLAVDGYAALAGAIDTRQAIATTAIVPGVGRGGGPGGYRGWDQALIEVAQRLAARGELTALDPARSIPSLTAAIERHATVTGAITDPAARTSAGPAVVTLVLRWLFDAIEPSPALVAMIGPALSRAAVAYPDSTRKMLSDLASGVGARDPGPSAAQCAVELVGERGAQVDHALAAVAQVPFSQQFLAELRGRLLQRCPAPTALADLETAAAAVTAFVALDRERGDADGFSFKLAVEAVVNHALAQTWTGATFAALADLVGFDLVSDATFCASRPSLSEQATCVDTLLARYSTAADDGLLAPAVASRYATLARQLTARWPALADLQYSTTRFDISDAWTDGLWRACTDGEFDRAAQQLFSLLTALRAATGFDERFEIEGQIADLVDPATCN